MDQYEGYPATIDRPKETTSSPKSPTAATDNTQKQPDARKYQELCDKPQSSNDRDLCQQWRMAKAAENQVYWIKWQVGTTAFEIFALLATLGAAIWAAIAATKAVRVATRVDRPYLIPADFSLRNIRAAGGENHPESHEHGIWIECDVRNVGTRTGFIQAIAVRHAEHLPPEPPNVILKNADQTGFYNVAPGDTFDNWLNVWRDQITTAEARGIWNGAVQFNIYGLVQYSDIHGTLRRSGFAYNFDRITRQGFIRCGPTAYWYDIEEQPEKKRWWQRFKRQPIQGEHP